MTGDALNGDAQAAGSVDRGDNADGPPRALEHRSLVVLTRPPLLRRALTPVTAPDQAYAVTSANTPAASPADALPDSSVAAPAQKARS